MGKVVSSVARAVTGAVKGVVQPVYNATLKNIPGVDSALTGLDKSVGKAIPGGWGTLASIAASFVPGAQFAALGLGKTAAMTGLGALTGSGVMRKGNNFNLQGALMGGAAAYGLSNLASGLEAAGGGGGPTASQVASQLGVEGAGTGVGSQAAMLADQAAGFGSQGLSNIASSAAPAIQNATSQGLGNAFAYNAAGEMVPSNISPSITGSVNPVIQAQPSGLSNLATGVGMQADTMGKGIANLSGLTGGEGTAAAARAALTGSGATLTNTALPLVMGATGLADLEAQRSYLDQQLASNSLAQNEYNTQVAEIDRQIAIARKAMADNPWNVDPDRSATKGDTAYARSEEQQNLYDRSSDNLYANEPTMPGSTFTAARGGRVPYAVGGSIDDSSGMDEARGLYQGNMQKGFMGSKMPSYAKGGEAFERRKFLDMIQANLMSGGGNVSTPRFLSGGGDGMSDSIPAKINGRQEARLADGEVVIPADVVSHLGNGSSKAGAKRLYSMMDKVRQARTGTEKQGKQINPNKFMPA
jgi:hypothetical protein